MKHTIQMKLFCYMAFAEMQLKVFVPEPVICMFQGYMTVLRSYVMITVLRIYRLKMHVGDAYQIWMAMIKIRNMHLILKAMEKKWQIM